MKLTSADLVITAVNITSLLKEAHKKAAQASQQAKAPGRRFYLDAGGLVAFTMDSPISLSLASTAGNDSTPGFMSHSLPGSPSPPRFAKCQGQNPPIRGSVSAQLW